MYIDSHTHFDLILEEGQVSEDELMENLRGANLSHVVQVAIEAGNLAWSRDFALRHRDEGILFTAGLHPSSVAGPEECQTLRSFVKGLDDEARSLLFGIGECGFDFFRLRQPKEMQEAAFQFQIDLAKEEEIPLIIHSREAWEDTLRVLRGKGADKGIMHCFPGGRAEAKEALDLGFYISFAGNVTFKKAQILHESAAYVPLDRLLIETDAPFLTPVPHRGKPNRPEHIVHTYAFLAELRNESPETLREAVCQNFMNLASL